MMMRHALYEAANSHLRISKKWSVQKAWGVAVARKLAIIMHRMWVGGTEFRFGQPDVADAA
jgi:transposase